MEESVKNFYASLTPFYHLLYQDWEKSIARQASMLDAIIKENWGDENSSILDAACGIGTQCLGLAAIGYEVTASDLSPQEVERAKREASKRDLSLSFSVADMRSVYDHHGAQFDVVIACDNAVPHLLSDEEILRAFRQFFHCTKPGGGCLISVRDYDLEERTGQTNKVYGSREENGVNYLIFQHWKWQGACYDFSLYFIEDEGKAQCKTQVMRSRYYAIGTDQLIELMVLAGFQNVKRLDGVFFQPVIIGTRAA